VSTSESVVTELLASWRRGSEDAAQRLLPLVYDELRRRARMVRRGQNGHETLNTTALVHEAYLKLVDQEHADWNDRAHFLAVAATAMRHILVDHARERGALKRGGGLQHVDFEQVIVAADLEAEALLDLHDALVDLARIDSRLARVVECRFFGGLAEEETAEALGVTARTVRRDWTKAKALLHARLRA
jgi:RNA polymerase sigma factor (TIGR02999 family)